MTGLPRSVRVARAAFRTVARLLPRSFRERWHHEADADACEAFRRAHERAGVAGVARAAATAVFDVLRAAPREWWADLASTHSGTAGTEPRERMMNVTREFRHAARALLRRPAYAGTAALTLALGIGATVAIFAVVHAVVIQPLPYPDAHELVTVTHRAPGLDLPELNNSDGTLRFYRERASDFMPEQAAYGRGERNLVGTDRPERVAVVAAGPGLFEVLRTPPLLGRGFHPDDALEDAPATAVLTHETWRSRFAADPGVLGTFVQVDGERTEIVGVMPPGFLFPDADVDLYMPLYVDPEGPFGRFGTSMVARLAPGVGVEDASVRTEGLQAGLPDFFPGISPEFLESAAWGVSLTPFQEVIVGERVASALWIILGTVGVVLLIACANVANLFLVRAESRQKELAIRAAMGAGGRRLATGFLAEALLLGLTGGALGMALAAGGVDLLVSVGPERLPRLHEVGLDAVALAFGAAITVGAAVLLGAVPLIRHAGDGLAGILRDGGRSATDGRGRHRARNLLVASQLALALVLLVGSGLMLRSFQALQSVDPGFDPANVTSVGLSLDESEGGPEAARFFSRVAEEVAGMPGVAAVGLTAHVPAAGGSSNGGSFYIEGQPRDESPGALPPVAMYKAVGADYLGAIRQRLLEGRNLARTDWEGGRPVALVNQTFAERFFDGRALGEGIKWDEDEEFAEIVGVVADVREYGLREDVRPMAYLPMVVGDWGYPELSRMYLLVRSEGSVAVSVPAIRDLVLRLDADVPVTDVRTLDQVLADDMAETSFTMVLLGIASAVALFLGAIGLFGVISYVVGQRTREIGVRVALGAERGQIRGMVLRQGGVVAVAGVAVGLLGAWALSAVMGAVLYGVSSTDPATFVGAPLVLLGVATLATWLPARRASRVDPVVALRSD
ncbi:MAG: ABC transporter permease [Longimicrobiales bacterium]